MAPPVRRLLATKAQPYRRPPTNPHGMRHSLATKGARLAVPRRMICCKSVRMPPRGRAPTPDPSAVRRRRRNGQRGGQTILPPTATKLATTTGVESSSEEDEDGDEPNGAEGSEGYSSSSSSSSSSEDSSSTGGGQEEEGNDSDSGDEVDSDESEQEMAEYSPAELDDDDEMWIPSTQPQITPPAHDNVNGSSPPPNKKIKLEEGSGGSGAGSSSEQSLYFSPTNAKLKDQLECSICLELFRDPKMLDCGHTYCWVCIQQMLSTQPGPSNRARKISCPQCRQSITVPAKGLKTNQLIKSMVYKLKEEAMKEPPKIVDTAAADYRNCTQCCEPTDRKKLYICVDASHAEQKQGSSTAEVSECWDPEEVLCAVCILSTHRNHSTHPLAEVVSAEDRNSAILKLDGIRDVVESKLNSLLDLHLQEFNQFSQSRLAVIGALMNEALDFDQMRFKAKLDECISKAEQIEASLNQVHFNFDAVKRVERVRGLVGILVDGEAGSDIKPRLSKSTSTDARTEASFVELAKAIRQKVENTRSLAATTTNNAGNNDSTGQRSTVDAGSHSSQSNGLSTAPEAVTKEGAAAPPTIQAASLSRTAIRKGLSGLPFRSIPISHGASTSSALAASPLRTSTTLAIGSVHNVASCGQAAPSDVINQLPSQLTNHTSDVAIKREPNVAEVVGAVAPTSNSSATTNSAPNPHQPSSSNTNAQQHVGNKAKRPMSSFFWWMKENRQRIAQMENMKSASDVAKQCGVEWAAIAPKDRERWERMSREDRERYDRDRRSQRQ